MKTLQHNTHVHLYFIIALLFLSCEKETPEIIEEQELITTVELQFQTTDEPNQVIRWQVNQSTPEAVTLKLNTDYEVSIAFYDESDPGEVEDITEEVSEEADEHQVFYEFSSVDISFTSGDNDTLDSNGNPIFLHTVWNANTTGTGIFKAYLIHEPTSRNGDVRSDFGGETDVAIEIPITVME